MTLKLWEYEVLTSTTFPESLSAYTQLSESDEWFLVAIFKKYLDILQKLVPKFWAKSTKKSWKCDVRWSPKCQKWNLHVE